MAIRVGFRFSGNTVRPRSVHFALTPGRTAILRPRHAGSTCCSRKCSGGTTIRRRWRSANWRSAHSAFRRNFRPGNSIANCSNEALAQEPAMLHFRNRFRLRSKMVARPVEGSTGPGRSPAPIRPRGLRHRGAERHRGQKPWKSAFPLSTHCAFMPKARRI